MGLYNSSRLLIAIDIPYSLQILLNIPVSTIRQLHYNIPIQDLYHTSISLPLNHSSPSLILSSQSQWQPLPRLPRHLPNYKSPLTLAIYLEDPSPPSSNFTKLLRTAHGLSTTSSLPRKANLSATLATQTFQSRFTISEVKNPVSILTLMLSAP